MYKTGTREEALKYYEQTGSIRKYYMKEISRIRTEYFGSTPWSLFLKRALKPYPKLLYIRYLKGEISREEFEREVVKWLSPA